MSFQGLVCVTQQMNLRVATANVFQRTGCVMAQMIAEIKAMKPLTADLDVVSVLSLKRFEVQSAGFA